MLSMDNEMKCDTKHIVTASALCVAMSTILDCGFWFISVIQGEASAGVPSSKVITRLRDCLQIR